MAVSSNKLGPGKLTLGSPGSTKEWGAAIRKATLKPSVSEGDELTVLSGDTVVDEGTETWTLEGEVLQSYDADSLIKWCNDNTGKTLPFTYIAATGSGTPLKAAGQLIVRSLAYGGEVNTRNTSDFSFKVVGSPTFATT